MTQDLNLTTIAALPGSGAGHVAAMRPECSRPRYEGPCSEVVPPGAVPGSADNPLGLRSVADMQAQRGGA